MSKVISADVSDDLAKRIEDEQEEGESRSATVRRLVRAGLDNSDEGFSASTPLLIFGSLTLGIALEPVASSAFLVTISGAAFLLAAAIERGIL